MEHPADAPPPASPEADFLAWRERGDAAALERAFDALAPELLRVALHLVGQAADAEDLVQQTFLAVLQNPASWSAGRSLKPFLTTILRRRAIDAHRRRRGHEDLEPNLLEIVERAAPDDALLAKELSAELARALDGLPEPYRQAVLLRIRHGMSSPDIAHVLGASPGAVRMRLSRGYEMLRSALPKSLVAGLLTVQFSGRGWAALRVDTLRAAGTLTAGAASGASETVTQAAARGAGVAGSNAAAAGLAGVPFAVWVGALTLGLALLFALGRDSDAAPPDQGLQSGPLLERGQVPGPAGSGRAPVGTASAAAAARPSSATEPESAALEVVASLAGEPHAGLALELLVPVESAGPRLLRAATDAAGRAVFEDLHPGCFRLTTGTGVRQRIDLVPGERRETRLACAHPLEAHLAAVDSGGLPVPAALIEARTAAGNWFELGRADDAGRLTLQLAARPALLRARAPGRPPLAQLALPDRTSDAAPLELPVGRGGATLGVRLLDESGAPVERAGLAVGLARTPMPPDWGPDGLPRALPKFKGFERLHLFESAVELPALLPGQYWVLSEGLGLGAAAAVVELGPAESAEIELRLPPACALHLTAYDASSERMPSVELTLRSERGGRVHRGVTDGVGELRFEPLLPGRWGVFAALRTPGGDGAERRLADVDVDAHSGASLDLLLDDPELLCSEPGGALRIPLPRALDPQTPLALPRFQLFDSDGERVAGVSLQEAVTLAENLPPGVWRGRFSAVGCVPHDLAEVRIESGVEAALDSVELMPGAYLQLECAGRADVRLMRDGQPLADQILRPGSTTQLGPFAPGPAALEALSEGRVWRRELVLAAGEPTVLRIDP